MPTERAAENPPAALFLFAHQDDEFGVFQKIVDEVEAGSQVCCAYLTNGNFNQVSSARRNRESLAVLTKLGVKEKDIFFAGDTLSIPDAKLPAHLAQASNWIQAWLSGFPRIRAIHVTAWEGGHHDHDALHAITVELARKNDLLPLVRQFSLYNGDGCAGPLFRVLRPLPGNGMAEYKRMPWINRFRFLRHCLRYPSQAKTWLGLFPFVVLHYLWNGTQATQPVSSDNIRRRPHAGPLYYERRKFFTWEEMADRLAAWRAKESSGG